ncbi:MAG: P1 family peptidase [Caldilinea sp.]|nr:P1 family peptidase [Caldilineaceae bacterium]MCB9124214.1 P1 family peptidase [Caldilineaceae bacterium]MCO5210243.1 P1 family peptidase [Caldilinea sp.]MCW5840649.1 P1 family peptidase [Caldilinea sp.]
MSSRPRARALGLDDLWRLRAGSWNAITDVAGVQVGQTTVSFGDGALAPGYGPARTGVTVILPHGGNLFRDKVAAAVHTINGYGKACGFEQVRELGEIETPIALTNTLNVWRVADALVDHALAHNPDIGIHTSTVNPVVGECNDGYLNDIQGRHVSAEHVHAALAAAASGPVAEGAVGAGTGTTCYGWKGGIGTASRVTPAAQGGFTLGALVQTNFGRAEDLRFGGVALGQVLRPPQPPLPERGSVMVVLATDAPLDARQLHRLCVRAGAGLARTGTTVGHGSGDFAIAFSTTRRIAHEGGETGMPVTHVAALANEGVVLDGLFLAVVEAVEEAVLNSLCAAETTTGRDGHVRVGIPVDEEGQMLRRTVVRGEAGRIVDG